MYAECSKELTLNDREKVTPHLLSTYDFKILLVSY